MTLQRRYFHGTTGTWSTWSDDPGPESKISLQGYHDYTTAEFREKPAFEPHWRMNPESEDEAYLFTSENNLETWPGWIPVTVTPIED